MTDVFSDFAQLTHPEALKVLLVLFLSFLLGFEREGRKAHAGHYIFGGVRTFPLIGLLGYAVTLLSDKQILIVSLGFVVVGAFLLVSYKHKLASADDAGVTTEITGLLTYILGALVAGSDYWIAITLVVIALLLLELKTGLESLSEKIPSEEVVTFTKFLLLTAVILPAVPNQTFTIFHLNPFKTWLIVAAVSGISYGSYVIQKTSKMRGGVVFAAFLGGAYSSTVMTVVLARRAKRESRPYLFSGAMLVASGMMYLRLVVLLAFFSRALMGVLLVPFLVLGLVAIVSGIIWSRRNDGNAEPVEREYISKNPLELRSAFVFAVIFVTVSVTTGLVLGHFGTSGVYALGALMGFADVDPFIMSMTQTAGTTTPLTTAAGAIMLTTVSNNALKGIYAFIFADRQTGLIGLTALLILSLAGLLPLLAL